MLRIFFVVNKWKSAHYIRVFFLKLKSVITIKFFSFGDEKPDNLFIVGKAIFKKVIITETGLPGSPINGFLKIFPSLHNPIDSFF